MAGTQFGTLSHPSQLTPSSQASSTGLADPAYGLDARLSWSERRKLERYEKQVARDALKRGKAEERERRREEKVLAKQWKAFYKCVRPFFFRPFEDCGTDGEP